jgi:membrane protein DedA with SNARE-associated domain
MITVESFIETYGYLAILIGTFLEGETILVLGGFAAHRGYLSLPWVILAAFVGSLSGDQVFFYLGRRHSRIILAKRQSWKGRIERVQKLLDRFRTPLILAFRFLYGLRTVAPFVIGMSSVPTGRFIFLNAVGALVWAAGVGSASYLFGHAMEIVLGDIKRYELEFLVAIAITGAVIWNLHFYRRRKRRNAPAPPNSV